VTDRKDPGYALCVDAILGRKALTFTYDGYRRKVAPHVLGDGNGRSKLLAYQFAGETSSTLPVDGEWRCFELGKMQGIRLKDGPWRTGDRHRRQNSCVTTVDIDINPDAEQRFSWATRSWK
jgi:predicted DNA-binding transcriptional regulator YafY